MDLPAHNSEVSVWRQVQAGLRRALGESLYTVWIEPLELDSVRGTTVVLRAPRQTQAWLEDRYGRLLSQCVKTVLGQEGSITFQAPGGAGSRNGAETPARREPGQGRGREDRHELGLNPRYRFDQFIIGDGNRLAHAAALAVAEIPGQAYNPLFLHAPPGLGKTHLLQAIGNYVVAFGGGAKVRYTTAEAFTSHFITALGTKSLDRFKAAYRDADVLLLDDVQFLASKARTEEEFFHTFNSLYETGRQLVLTCDRLPSRLDGVAERLRERFEAGLVADIDPPDFSTRVAILRKRAAIDHVAFAEPGVLELIAERVTDNVRALEGALIRVVAYHSLTGGVIDRALAQRVLDGMHYPPAGARSQPPAPGKSRSSAPVSITAIQAAVAAYYGLSVDDLISASRTARIAWPRQLAIYLARELTGTPVAAIGSAFGGRNHATVLHACKRVATRLCDDRQATVEIEELTRKLRGERGDRSY